MTLEVPSLEEGEQNVVGFKQWNSNRHNYSFHSHIRFDCSFYPKITPYQKKKNLKPLQCSGEWEFFNEADLGLISDLATSYLHKLGQVVGIIIVSTQNGMIACRMYCCASHRVNSYYTLALIVVSDIFPLCQWPWPTKI